MLFIAGASSASAFFMACVASATNAPKLPTRNVQSSRNEETPLLPHTAGGMKKLCCLGKGYWRINTLTCKQQALDDSEPPACLHRLHRFHGLSKDASGSRDARAATAGGFFQHLARSAPRKRHMHILPSWLSSPSWPHKHAACWIPLLKNFPRKRGPNGRSTPMCLHRLHCLHGSHDDRCGKRAGARRGVRDPRSGCSNRVNVAPQSRSRLPLTGPILDTQHVRQTTSCTPRIDLESDVALASCSHSLTA